MLPLLAIGALAGAALGGIKTAAFDAPRASRQNKLAAETIRNSPWTGMKPGPVDQVDAFGNVLGGAMTGASFAAGNPKLFGGASASPGGSQEASNAMGSLRDLFKNQMGNDLAIAKPMQQFESPFGTLASRLRYPQNY